MTDHERTYLDSARYCRALVWQWIVVAIIFGLIFWLMPARAEEEHDHSKMGATGQFYQTWMRPKGEYFGIGHRQSSCCNRTDCSPVIELNVRGGQLWARVELSPDNWYRVPRSVMESNQTDPRESPDHRAHACIIGGQVVCFVEGGGV